MHHYFKKIKAKEAEYSFEDLFQQEKGFLKRKESSFGIEM